MLSYMRASDEISNECIEGWRVSTEQQISDLALQKLSSSVEKGVDAAAALDNQSSSSEQVLDRVREAAYSIFEQYLSEKVSKFNVK